MHPSGFARSILSPSRVAEKRHIPGLRSRPRRSTSIMEAAKTLDSLLYSQR